MSRMGIQVMKRKESCCKTMVYFGTQKAYAS